MKEYVRLAEEFVLCEAWRPSGVPKSGTNAAVLFSFAKDSASILLS
jgi:hypothetical protein